MKVVELVDVWVVESDAVWVVWWVVEKVDVMVVT